MPPRRPEHDLGVRATADESREGHGFVERNALAATHRVGVSPDLGVDRIGESEPLVAKLGHELGIEVAVGGVHEPDRLEQGKWEQRINGARSGCVGHGG